MVALRTEKSQFSLSRPGRARRHSPNDSLPVHHSLRVLELGASLGERASEVVSERRLGVIHPLRVDADGPLSDDLLLRLHRTGEVREGLERLGRRLGRKSPPWVPVGSGRSVTRGHGVLEGARVGGVGVVAVGVGVGRGRVGGVREGSGGEGGGGLGGGEGSGSGGSRGGGGSVGVAGGEGGGELVVSEVNRGGGSTVCVESGGERGGSLSGGRWGSVNVRGWGAAGEKERRKEKEKGELGMSPSF